MKDQRAALVGAPSPCSVWVRTLQVDATGSDIALCVNLAAEGGIAATRAARHTLGQRTANRQIPSDRWSRAHPA